MTDACAMIQMHDEQLTLLGGVVSTASFNALEPDAQARVRILETRIWELVAQGTSPLWACQHSAPLSNPGAKPNAFFTRVSMRNGPGDVARGSFAKLDLT